MTSLCFIIPVFNHPDGIRNTIPELAKHKRTCIIVDDGSNNTCRAIVDALAQEYDWVQVHHHKSNSGKGAAVKTALRLAADMDFSHALQLDADQQHDLSAIDACLSASSENPDATILGAPEFDASMPKVRLYFRYLTHIWVWINTLSLTIKDSMCGFRVYRVGPTLEVCTNSIIGDHMDFDTEILVRLYWQGMNFVSVPVRTFYPDGGLSHFRLLQDNWLITRMHAKLFVGMLWRSPRLLKRALHL